MELRLARVVFTAHVINDALVLRSLFDAVCRGGDLGSQRPLVLLIGSDPLPNAVQF